MSNNTEFKVSENLNEWTDWIEDAISRKLIKYYEYEYFSNFKEIGSGGFGRVHRANWKSSRKPFALKSFFSPNKFTVKEILREVFIN